MVPDQYYRYFKKFMLRVGHKFLLYDAVIENGTWDFEYFRIFKQIPEAMEVFNVLVLMHSFIV